MVINTVTSRTPVLLVVDDEKTICEIVARQARICGFDVAVCGDGRQALEYMATYSADLALIDLRMPHVGGLEVLRTIRQHDPSCEVILMSGAGSIHDAVEAIKLGARDYLQKPFELSALKHLLEDAKIQLQQRKQVLALQHQLVQELDFSGMVGRSAPMQELFGMIRRLAPHVRTVLVTGENGTGKELVARALHARSPRSNREFLTVSCSGVGEALAESDLLGHIRGAFPGATEDRAGAFEIADGGVLFLDEVAELPLALQGRLLRILEHGTVNRVGSLESRPVDVVVIASTVRDLRTEMLAGRFRTELFHRLASVELHVPALRERKQDLPYLAAAFVHDCAARLGKNIAGLTAPAETLLQSREWRGNVRQLRNVIDHACMVAEGEFLTEREIQHAIGQAR